MLQNVSLFALAPLVACARTKLLQNGTFDGGSGLNLITPCSSNDSYLYHKLADTHLEVGGKGSRMPHGDPASDSELEKIRDWIDAGAPYDSNDEVTCKTEQNGNRRLQDFKELTFENELIYGIIIRLTGNFRFRGPGNSILDLGSGQSAYDSTVRVTSRGSNLDLITPCSAEKSYVYHKLAGTHLQVGGRGSRMPAIGDFPSQDDMDMIRQWIDSGAPFRGGDAASC
eukprot:g72158.t1